jgi:hypothetical protein
LASWLVLDWEHEKFHVLTAQTTRRGISVSQAVTWAHPEPLTPSTAERVGKALRDFLKAQRIAAAPVIVGIGRDRIFLKELRFPAIAAHEEANLVRFQTGKEMAEAVDNYAVDYAYLESGGSERQIMTVAARRDIVATIQALCQGAGLKLHAVTPRLFGVSTALARSADPNPLGAKKLTAVLTIGQRWAELCFFRGTRLLQAQALANGPLLPGEIKRNLAVFSAQHAVDVSLSGPDALYVFGGAASVVDDVEAGQPLKVKKLNPLERDGIEAKNPGAFAGAVGLAALWSEGGQKPVNLSTPKRSSAPVSITRQRAMVYGAAAALVLLGAIAGMYYVLADRRAKIAELSALKEQQSTMLSQYAQERADLDAYREWEQTSIPWLDEMYDLTSRYPYHQGFRINQLNATTTGAKKGSKDGFVGAINLRGQALKGEGKYVYELQSSMARDAHLRPGIGPLQKDGTEFAMKIEVAKQDAKKYDLRLVVPPRPRASAADKPPPDDTMTKPPMPDAEEGDDEP